MEDLVGLRETASCQFGLYLADPLLLEPVGGSRFANDLPVYTCNPDDFKGIDGLEVIPVPPPERWTPGPT